MKVNGFSKFHKSSVLITVHNVVKTLKLSCRQEMKERHSHRHMFYQQSEYWNEMEIEMGHDTNISCVSVLFCKCVTALLCFLLLCYCVIVLKSYCVSVLVC